MTPVEATTTSSGRMPSFSAQMAAIRRASARPCSPVHTLALPLLTTMARHRAGLHVLLCHQERRSLYPVGRKRGRGAARPLGENQGDILFCRLMPA